MESNPLVTQVGLGGSWKMMIFAGIVVTLVRALTMLPLRKLPNTTRILLGYTLLSGLFIAEYPVLHFGPYNTAFVAAAAQSVIELVFTLLAALVFYDWIPKLIPYAALIACVRMWLCDLGYLTYISSFNTAFAALCLPFLPWWIGLVVVFTVGFHHGSTALLIWAVVALCQLTRKQLFLSFVLLTGVVLVLGYVHQNQPWFDSMDRIEHWRRYMEFWAKEKRWILLGVGPGSFTHISMQLDHYKSPLFLQMHSDWLQILWENGVVGLGLTLAVFVQATKRVWRNPQLLGGVLGAAVFGLTYYPLRYFPSALLVAWIFLRAFNYKSSLLPTRPSSWSDQAKSQILAIRNRLKPGSKPE